MLTLVLEDSVAQPDIMGAEAGGDVSRIVFENIQRYVDLSRDIFYVGLVVIDNM